MNIAVLASGSGTNFQAIVEKDKKRYFKASIKLLITDKQNSFVRKRACRYKIPDIYVNPGRFKSRVGFDKEVARILKKEKIDLVVLAGFMRILSPYFVRQFKNRILNIHPALLPSFKGIDSIKRAYAYGVKIIGVTVHFVDVKTDHGPIILQEAVRFKQKDSLKKIEAEIHKIEHRLYPEAIKLFSEKKLKVKGRKVFIRK